MKGTLKRAMVIVLAISMSFGSSFSVLAEDQEQETDYVVPKESIKSIIADKEASGYEAENAIDGDVSTIWHSPWDDAETEGFPHYLVVEFEEVQQINTVWYQPRTGGEVYQFINDYEFLVSATSDGDDFAPVEENAKWSGEVQSEVSTRFKETVSAKRIKFLMKGQDSNAHDKFCTSVAELRFGRTSESPDEKPEEGAEITGIKAIAVSSENSDYKKEKTVDGNTSTFWHNEWQPQAPCPHWIEFDLNEIKNVKELQVMPRQDQITTSSPMAITKYNLYVKDKEDEEYKLAVANGKLDIPKKGEFAKIQFSHAIPARYIKLEVVEDAKGINSAIAEFKAFSGENTNSVWEELLYTFMDAKKQLNSVSVGDEFGQYPEDSYQKYCEVLEDAELVLNNPNADEAEFNSAKEEILSARAEFEGTIKLYTKKELKEKITEARELKDSTKESDGPSKEQFEILGEAIESAQAVYDSEDVSEMQVHQEYGKLSDACERFRNKINTSVIDLSGTWDFAMSAYTGASELSDTVQLPGTMDENKKGSVNDDYTDKTRLSPKYRYVGKAVYQKEITVPDNWEGKKVTLTLERTRNTTVWLNGEEIGSSDALGVAQTYDLSGLNAKETNILSVEVDNSKYASQTWRSHMVVEETQGNWNGIVGEISLKMQDPVYIEDIRIYPEKANETDDTVNTARVHMELGNISGEDVTGATVKVSAVSRNTDKPEQKIEEKEFKVDTIKSGDEITVQDFNCYMGNDVYLWDEFDPALYDVTVTLEAGDVKETQTVTTGMREYTQDGDHFVINGKRIFLRGEANCAVFPLTAYPPMDKEEWIDLLSKAKEYGLNHYRFHSWSPPKAAYEAADELGMYLQPELYAFTGNPLVSDKQFYSDESQRIVKALANYPSFVSFTFGNEIFPSQSEAVELTSALREIDNTRLYAAASNNLGASGGYYPGDSEYWDFWIAMYSDRGDREIRGSNGENGFINLEQPATTRTYYDALDGIEIPFVSHEIGQFQQYPDFDQIEKYTGVFEARNLEIAKNSLESKGMLDQNKEFAVASGKLAAICYRAEVEAALRTSNMGGYELLGLQDFSGQGSALVGILDAFMETKEGMPTGEEFRRYNSAVTMLGLMPKYVWTNDEEFTAEVEIANYGSGDLSVTPVWSLKHQDGTEVAAGTGKVSEVKQGDVTSVCNIQAELEEIKEAEKLSLEIGVEGGDILTNQYDVWVYPSKIETKVPDDIMVVSYMTSEAEQFLQDGGNVLILPEIDKTSLPESVNGNFTPTFWSGMWFPTTFNTMGFVTDETHPIFNNFPTESHSNWQWWNLVKNSRPIILDDTDKSYRPILQAIDNFGNDKSVDGAINNRKLGLIFEGNVGEGKLLVCSIDLLGANKSRPEAKQLYNSIIQYMSSEDFNPSYELSLELINRWITKADIADGIAVNRTEEGYPKPFASYSLGGEKRLWNILDSNLDITVPNEAWTSWDGTNSSDYIGVEFEGPVKTGMINLYVFEDHGCKAPAAYEVQYLKGEEWVPVENPQLLEKDAMTVGKNTVTFDEVITSQIRIVMTPQEGMALAITEFDVQGTDKIVPTSIQIAPEDGQTSVKLGETLEMGITYEPQEANATEVIWTVEDGEGNVSGLAEISSGGQLIPKAAGKVIVKAVLKANPEVSASIEIEILENEVPETVNRDKLTDTINANKDKKEADYTEESWKVFADALDYAQKIVAAEGVTQEQVDEAEKKLAEAAENLKKKDESQDPSDNPDDNKPGSNDPDNSQPGNNKPGNNKPDNNKADGKNDKTNTSQAVKTGDTNRSVIYIVCICFAMALGVGVVLKKKMK